LTKLVYEIVGAKLGKGLTFSHWDRRPLTDHQLRYAADDVRYLPAVRHEIGKRLNGPEQTRWATEESASLAEQALYVFDPETQWLKIRGAGTLAPRNQALLKELTLWRDEAAKAEDVPPRSLLKDEILIDLARSPAEAATDLAHVKGLPRLVESKYGAGIIAATEHIRNLPQDHLPAIKGYEPSPSEKFAADALFYAIQCLCAGQGIDPSLLASRQEVGELHRLLTAGQDPNNLRIMRGWRREAVGNRMLELFKGHGELSVGWRDGILSLSPHASR
jgi:ribonuclease D